MRVLGLSTNLSSWYEFLFDNELESIEIDEHYQLQRIDLAPETWRDLGVHGRNGVVSGRFLHRSRAHPDIEFFDVGLWGSKEIPAFGRRVRRVAPLVDQRDPYFYTRSYVALLRRAMEFWSPRAVAVHCGLAFRTSGEALVAALEQSEVGTADSHISLMFEGYSSGQRDMVQSCRGIERLGFTWLSDYRSPRELAARLFEYRQAGPDHSVRADGRGAAPGVVRGAAYADASTAMVHAKHGEPIILVLDDDEWGEAEIEAAIHSAGIVARSGGLVSHAAVAARGFGIPAVVGVKDLEILANRGMLISGTFVPEGSYIEVNGDDGIVRLLDS